MNKNLMWRMLPLVLFLGLAIFLGLGLKLDPQKLPSQKIGHPLPAFSLPLLGAPQKTIHSTALKGHVFLLNVWASWCKSCVEEQDFLMKLSHTKMPVYGLNYKDTSANALNWLTQWGNPYQWIAEDQSGHTAIDLGVYGVPETFLVDAKGIILYRHAGVLDEDIWQHEFLPRIEKIRS